MATDGFRPSLPTNTKPFRFCNECPALLDDVKGRPACLTFGRLKSKTKLVSTRAGDPIVVKEPLRHVECKGKPKNAEEAVRNRPEGGA